MYCKKCGKFVGTDADFCDECAKGASPLNESETHQSASTSETAPLYQVALALQDTSVIKLGRAIASIILATVGFIFVYAGLMYAFEPTTALVCLLLGLVPNVLGLIFGIRSILNFKKTGYIKNGKRIPVLILGIYSVVMTACSFFASWMLLLLILCM